MKYLASSQSVIIIVLMVLLQPTAADPAKIKLLSPIALTTVMNELVPQFEKLSGKTIIVGNGNVGTLTNRVAAGEAADAVIVSTQQIDLLQKQGKVIPNSELNLAKVGIGLFVRKGAPKPDISSVDAFKRTLKAAKSIMHGPPNGGGPVAIYVATLFERLGLSEEMKPKTRLIPSGRPQLEAVASGDVELGLLLISEIISEPNVELIGPLPAEIQNYTSFTGGIVSLSRAQEEGRAMLQFFASANARVIWKQSGFEVP